MELVGGVHYDLCYDFTAAGRPDPHFGRAVPVREKPGPVRHHRRHRGQLYEQVQGQEPGRQAGQGHEVGRRCVHRSDAGHQLHAGRRHERLSFQFLPNYLEIILNLSCKYLEIILIFLEKNWKNFI